MKDIHNWINTALIVLVAILVLVGGNQSESTDLAGSGSRFPHGISADSTSPSTGQVRGTSFLATGSITAGSSGTSLEQVVCSDATTWNPGSVASTSIATLDVTTTGFALGDTLFAGLATTTQGLGLLTSASTTDVVRVTLFQPDFDAVALDLATTTVKVCAVRS